MADEMDPTQDVGEETEDLGAAGEALAEDVYDAGVLDDDDVMTSQTPPDIGSETGRVSGMQTTDLRPGMAEPTPLAHDDAADTDEDDVDGTA